ncbi:MAG: response regulator transcription factor [Clostridia bacterium]|jgi:DNA-binding response OmpR family regulator
MQKILIVEDDKKLSKELEKFLSQNGYEISRITSFENIINDILNSKCNMVLLDINLPGNNGEYICKEVRKISEVPIVMITSVDSELDQLISLNYGADDYITKPFNIQILLAKIATILKRTNSNNKDQSKIDCKDFILNLSKSTIEKEEKEIELTKNEFKIIYYLVQNRGKIVPREEIMSYLWDSEMFVDDNTLTVNITRIRNKLEEINLKDILETRRGQGYILI